jgi:hypothetical protein
LRDEIAVVGSREICFGVRFDRTQPRKGFRCIAAEVGGRRRKDVGGVRTTQGISSPTRIQIGKMDKAHW